MAHRPTTTPSAAAPAKAAGRPRAAASRAVPATAPSLTDALTAAAWAEADTHLARAWRETELLQADLAAALAALIRREGAASRPSAARRRLAAALDRAAFTTERIAAAARLRRLERGPAGLAAFDPKRHAGAPDGPEPAPGAQVRIVARAVVRRTGADEEVLVRALVAAAKPRGAAARASSGVRAGTTRRPRKSAS